MQESPEISLTGPRRRRRSLLVGGDSKDGMEINDGVGDEGLSWLFQDDDQEPYDGSRAGDPPAGTTRQASALSLSSPWWFRETKSAPTSNKQLQQPLQQKEQHLRVKMRATRMYDVTVGPLKKKAVKLVPDIALFGGRGGGERMNGLGGGLLESGGGCGLHRQRLENHHQKLVPTLARRAIPRFVLPTKRRQVCLEVLGPSPDDQDVSSSGSLIVSLSQRMSTSSKREGKLQPHHGANERGLEDYCDNSADGFGDQQQQPNTDTGVVSEHGSGTGRVAKPPARLGDSDHVFVRIYKEMEQPHVQFFGGLIDNASTDDDDDDGDDDDYIDNLNPIDTAFGSFNEDDAALCDTNNKTMTKKRRKEESEGNRWEPHKKYKLDEVTVKKSSGSGVLEIQLGAGIKTVVRDFRFHTEQEAQEFRTLIDQMRALQRDRADRQIARYKRQNTPVDAAASTQRSQTARRHDSDIDSACIGNHSYVRDEATTSDLDSTTDNCKSSETAKSPPKTSPPRHWSPKLASKKSRYKSHKAEKGQEETIRLLIEIVSATDLPNCSPTGT